MKSKSIFTLILLFSFQIGYTQTDKIAADFIELGIQTKHFLQSDYLQKSEFSHLIADPMIDVEGLMPYYDHFNFSFKLKYGKVLNQRTHLITEIGYNQRAENTICFCHVCDKAAQVNTLTTVKSLDLGIGARYRIKDWNRFHVSVEGSTVFSTATNQSKVIYFGYYLAPILGFQVSKNLMLNAKTGLEQSFGQYSKIEAFGELALGWQF